VGFERSADDSDHFEQRLELDHTDYHTHHHQPSPAAGIPSAFGLGDINPSLFLSPANSGKLIWGVGPTMTFPTATDSLLGDGKWSAGPGLVVLTMPGHWVIGALANNQWSFAGWGLGPCRSAAVLASFSGWASCRLILSWQPIPTL